SRLRAEMLSIGTELLLGQVVDTNAAYISERLAQLGIDLYFRHTVGDNRLRLAAVLSHALVRSDIVITSGGLGPTQDDLTKEVVAGLFAEPLEERPEAVRHIEEVLARAGRPVSQNNLRQALFPPSAELIPNPVGTAPGMWLEREGRLIICLPGVPAELKAMMEQTVVPRLAERRGGGLLRSRTLRFFGIGESALEEAIADLIEAQSNPTIAPYAGTGDVKVRLTARASSEAEALSLIEPVEVEIRSRLGAYLYGYDDDTLEGVVGRHLRSRGWRLAVAESCTGGLVSHLLTNVPGSSDYLLESVVAYSNEAKERRLGVPA